MAPTSESCCPVTGLDRCSAAAPCGLELSLFNELQEAEPCSLIYGRNPEYFLFFSLIFRILNFNFSLIDAFFDFLIHVNRLDFIQQFSSSNHAPFLLPLLQQCLHSFRSLSSPFLIPLLSFSVLAIIPGIARFSCFYYYYYYFSFFVLSQHYLASLSVRDREAACFLRILTPATLFLSIHHPPDYPCCSQ